MRRLAHKLEAREQGQQAHIHTHILDGVQDAKADLRHDNNKKETNISSFPRNEFGASAGRLYRPGFELKMAASGQHRHERFIFAHT